MKYIVKQFDEPEELVNNAPKFFQEVVASSKEDALKLVMEDIGVRREEDDGYWEVVEVK